MNHLSYLNILYPIKSSFFSEILPIFLAFKAPDFYWWSTHPVSLGGADPSARSLNDSLAQLCCSRTGGVVKILQQRFHVPSPSPLGTVRAAEQEVSLPQGSSVDLPGHGVAGSAPTLVPPQLGDSTGDKPSLKGCSTFTDDAVLAILLSLRDFHVPQYKSSIFNLVVLHYCGSLL